MARRVWLCWRPRSGNRSSRACRSSSSSADRRIITGTIIVAVYFAAFAVLAVYALHRVWLLFLLRRFPASEFPIPIPITLPCVTVQLPIFNERFVIERLLRAVERLDYPRELLDVQVLDDSTDHTRELIAQEVRAMQQRGVPISHITRPARTGFKAGALAHGLGNARGEFILILDADFVPQPSLIRELLAPMNDPGVGMVQARWGHINGCANALTRAQALLLDAHFLLETEARARAKLCFNFHGTAGLWRRRAIDDAGGWSADTVTEDLDLSYRVQLAGWRFVFLRDVVVPAELPATLAAFRQQQARWARGTIATARKHLRAILLGDLPLRMRAEAFVHLTCHVIYPATLIVALAALPALLYRNSAGLNGWFWLDSLLALCVIVPTRMFYRTAARAAGTPVPGIRQMPFLMLTGIALSISNTRAVLAGAVSRRGDFERTPKAGGWKQPAMTYAVRTSSLLRSLDGGVAVYLLWAATIAAAQGFIGAVPAFGFLAIAFGAAAIKG
ncbi:MAG: glycosyltransferase [Gemmatimonadota bacterium]